MKWIKDAILDILVLILITSYALTHYHILEYIIWGYTGLLLIGKTLFFFVDFLKSKAVSTTVPDWFYHVIYLSSSALLVLAQNYYLAVTWLVIWILSVAASIVQKKKKK